MTRGANCCMLNAGLRDFSFPFVLHFSSSLLRFPARILLTDGLRSFLTVAGIFLLTYVPGSIGQVFLSVLSGPETFSDKVRLSFNPDSVLDRFYYTVLSQPKCNLHFLVLLLRLFRREHRGFLLYLYENECGRSFPKFGSKILI